MKSKTAPQTTRQKLFKWLPLIGAYTFIYTWIGLGKIIYGFPDNPNHPFMQNDHWVVFYLRSVVYGVTVLVVIGLHGMALERKVTRRVVLVSGFIAVYLLGNFTLSENRWIHAVTYVESLSVDDHTYHLLKNDYHTSWPSRAYIVLECESTGLRCHYYATPSHCLVMDAHLEQNPITQGLMLRRELYTIEFDTHEKTNETYIGCESRP